MRRISIVFAFAAGIAFTACGDDKKEPTADVAVSTDVADDDVASTDTTTPDTSVTPDTTPPADVAVQTDTTPADTTVEPPDLGEGTCGGMIACIDACFTEECETACLAAADSEAETAALTALNTCMTDNACVPASETPTDEEVQAGFACALANCVDATVACYQGATVGTGKCGALGGCVNDCEDDDLACTRGCYENAAVLEASYLVQLDLCLEAECYSSTATPTETESCITQAREQQPCSLKLTQCQGNIGAGPGSGAGGGE